MKLTVSFSWSSSWPMFCVIVLITGVACPTRSSAHEPASSIFGDSPVLDEIDRDTSPLRQAIGRYRSDQSALERFLDVPMSPWRQSRFEAFYGGWLEALGRIDFDALEQDGKIDYLLLRNRIERDRRRLAEDAARDLEARRLIPFASVITDLAESRRRKEPVASAEVAGRLTRIVENIEELRARLDKATTNSDAPPVSKTVALRASRRASDLRDTLRSWYRFYDGYDPEFTWWVRDPHARLERELADYSKFLRERLVGVRADDRDAIVGEPIGKDALLAALRHEMIPYSPQELVDIADREFEWCDREMLRASRELGFGDDWRKAQDAVKRKHVKPGEQPQLIRQLAEESVRFLEDRQLVTIPSLCRQIWRMEMMSPERQKVNPYFTGGEVISVSFPTDSMDHDSKLMSLRGNNIHFSRATVHHELIPGHHLQGFMNSRHRAHRRLFRTPFWVEGWALYWEMLLWDLDFPRSPEDRIGMLFWRKHRCARIIFSLSYHLETMTVDEAIDFLIERVGHERNNATAEVRRSVQGGYSPLYQAAYMLGGLQIRALHRDLVGSKKMTDRAFHDAVLRENAIPIEFIRAKLTDQELTRDYRSEWRFYESLRASE